MAPQPDNVKIILDTNTVSEFRERFNNVVANTNQTYSDIGNLDSLTLTSNNVADALNELYADMGDVANLNTLPDAANCVAAINYLLANQITLWEKPYGIAQLKTAANIDARSKYIFNVLDPVNAQDAATKNYVDVQIVGVVANASPVHNALTGLQGGITDEYYHLSNAQYVEITTFFDNTDFTNAEAETLTDGSNADALHIHSSYGISDFEDRVNSLTGTSISNTDALTEGVTNLYFTNTRVDARFNTDFALKDTDDLSEGTTNLYYTDTRFDTRFSSKSTTNLSEGTNLYFTNERVDDRVSSLIINGTGLAWTYDDGANTLRGDVSFSLSGYDTDDLSEGSTNLYFSNARVDARIVSQNYSILGSWVFDTNLPTSNVTPTLDYQFITKSYCDNAIANVSLSTFTSGSVIFANATGVLSEDNANLFYSTSNNYFGIQTNSPFADLHVLKTGTPFSVDNYSTAIIQHSGSTISGVALHLISGNAALSHLMFGDTDNANVASVGYDHASDKMFFTNSGSSTKKLVIDTVGFVGINEENPSGNLHISNTGPVLVIIEADSDNANENDTPILRLSQDGGAIVTELGMEGIAGTAHVGTLDNATYLGNSYVTSALQFYTNNTVCGTFLASGYLGLGLTNPATQLEVAGIVRITSTQPTLQFKDTDVLNTCVIDTPSGNMRLGIWDATVSANFYWATATYASNSFNVVFSNNVGIGITPNAPLTVLKADATKAIVVKESDNGNDAIQMFGNTFYGYADFLASGTVSTRISAYSDSYFNVSSGKVGIGTSTPNNPLEIKTLTYNQDHLRLTTQTTSLNTNGIDFYSTNGVYSTAKIISGHGGGYVAPYIRIQVADSGKVLRDRLSITKDGKVGINTISPEGYLTINGYTGGVGVSAVSAYTKNLVIGGTFNSSYNSGNAVLIYLGDYSNDATDNVYPIYCESENNDVDFYIKASVTGGLGYAFVGGQLTVGGLPESGYSLTISNGLYANGTIKFSSMTTEGYLMNDSFGLITGGNPAPAGSTYWTNAGARLYPAYTTNTVAIGTTSTSGSKLYVVGGAVPALFSNGSCAVEIAHAGSNTNAIQMDGTNGAYRISVESNVGSVMHMYGAHLNLTTQQYDNTSVYPFLMSFNTDGSFKVNTAATGTVNTDITWNVGLNVTKEGYLGVNNTLVPLSPLHVSSKVGQGVPMVVLTQADTGQSFINFAYLGSQLAQTYPISTIGVGSATVTGPADTVWAHTEMIRVSINGSVRYIPAYTGGGPSSS